MKVTKQQLKQLIKEALENYYNTLEVNRDKPAGIGGQPTSDLKAIKKAYRAVAMKHHPDRGGDPEKMKKVNIAKDTLLTPDNKKKYDQELYKDAMACKEKAAPGHRFCGHNAVNITDDFLIRFAELAGIKPAEGGVESEPAEGGVESEPAEGSVEYKMKTMEFKDKIMRGIQKRFMDLMKQNKTEEAQRFLDLYTKVRQINDLATLQKQDLAQFAGGG